MKMLIVTDGDGSRWASLDDLLEFIDKMISSAEKNKNLSRITLEEIVIRLATIREEILLEV